MYGVDIGKSNAPTLHIYTLEIERESERSQCWWKVKTFTGLSKPRDLPPGLKDNQLVPSSDKVIMNANWLAYFFKEQHADKHPFNNTSGPGPEIHCCCKTVIHPSSFYLYSNTSWDTVSTFIESCCKTSISYYCLLKTCSPLLSAPLSYLFNIFSPAWKCAVVTWIFKNHKSARSPSNYHPIPLLIAVGKPMDSIQSSHSLFYQIHTNLISPHQFSLTAGWSTVTRLVYIMDKNIWAFDHGEAVALCLWTLRNH